MAMGDDDKAKGTWDQMKGRAKKAIGELTDDDDKKAEGEQDKAKGSFEKLKGNVKNLVDPDQY